MQTFLVGGAVRDQIMGRPCKDFDYTVVLNENDVDSIEFYGSDPFDYMRTRLFTQGYKIFVESPAFFTVRAKFPKGHVNEGQVADFVLARKEGDYTDGRRPDRVEVGTLADDIARRDFTMNALAQREDGSIVDLHGGQQDISDRIIRTVGDPMDRFGEDSLRILRALRFAITLDFDIDHATAEAMNARFPLLHSVSKERINDEVTKMFAHSTVDSVYMLFREYRRIGAFLIGDMGVRLMPTLKEK